MKIVHKALTISGVFFAALLFVAGLTGSLLAFYNEIDEMLNPAFYHVEVTGDLLPPPVLIEKLEQAKPEILVWYLQYPKNPGETAMMTAQPLANEAGNYPDIPSDVFYMNPYTAQIVGEKFWGRCCFEPGNLLNFLYEIHHSLKDGSWGGYFMGMAAMALLINGLWVLFGGGRKPGSGGWAFLIPTRNRVVGMVLALLLLPVAVSSIALNLTTEVFKPLVSVFSPVAPSIYEEYAKKNPSDSGSRVLSYDDAYQLAQKTGREHGWTGPVAELFYSSSYNFYGMAFGYRDPDGMGNNWIYLDGVDGRPVGSKRPREGSAGDTLFYAQLPIHSGRIAGLPSKILIAALGLLIAVLAARYIFIKARCLLQGSPA